MAQTSVMWLYTNQNGRYRRWERLYLSLSSGCMISWHPFGLFFKFKIVLPYNGFELTPRIAHGILKQCPELVLLSLDITLSDELDNEAQEPLDITLCSLTTLSVEFGDYKLVEDFLKDLAMPSLSRLEITSSHEISTFWGWNRESFFNILCNFNTISILKFDLPFPLDNGISSYLFFDLPCQWALQGRIGGKNIRETFRPLQHSTNLRLSSRT